jgi:hypothetical protein
MGKQELAVRVRLYEELNRALPEAERKTTVFRSLPPGATLGDLVDSLGLRREEIDLALVNAVSVPFSRVLDPGDLVSLYPVFESLDIGASSALRAVPLRNPRFLAEQSLQELSRLLVARGYDCICPPDAAPRDLSRISKEEGRILLTRDVDMAGRYALDRCLRIRSQRPEEQLREVMRRFQLEGC